MFIDDVTITSGDAKNNKCMSDAELKRILTDADRQASRRELRIENEKEQPTAAQEVAEAAAKPVTWLRPVWVQSFPRALRPLLTLSCWLHWAWEASFRPIRLLTLTLMPAVRMISG